MKKEEAPWEKSCKHNRNWHEGVSSSGTDSLPGKDIYIWQMLLGNCTQQGQNYNQNMEFYDHVLISGVKKIGSYEMEG